MCGAMSHAWETRSAFTRDCTTCGALASSAVSRRAQLPEREQKLAAALLHMASGQFPAACRLYDELRHADPHDFAATFGLGECVRRDEVVVPDAHSPTGWRFRASR